MNTVLTPIIVYKLGLIILQMEKVDDSDFYDLKSFISATRSRAL